MSFLHSNTPSWAIITPSYRGDFERCRLLCESLDLFVTGNWHHYIVVESIDMKMFSILAGPNRSILEMESLLPKSIHHLARIPIINNRSLWYSWRTGFMLGWHVQQLVKMEMAFRVKEPGLLYCDSDVFFVRPFDVANLVTEGRYRFFRTAVSYDEANITNPKFTTASARQLGLETKPYPCPTYVENLVPWHAATTRNLCEHIAQVSGRDWRITLGRDIIISEYTLYGLYIERVLKNSSSFQIFHDGLCKTIWVKTELDDRALDQFFENLEPHIVAIGVQSFVGIKIERLQNQFQRAALMLK